MPGATSVTTAAWTATIISGLMRIMDTQRRLSRPTMLRICSICRIDLRQQLLDRRDEIVVISLGDVKGGEAAEDRVYCAIAGEEGVIAAGAVHEVGAEAAEGGRARLRPSGSRCRSFPATCPVDRRR